MKNLISVALCGVFIGTSALAAQPAKKRTMQKPAPQARMQPPAQAQRKSPLKIYPRTNNINLQQQMQQALAMAKAGQTQNAANALFSLGRRSELAAERPQIKYLLGLMLMELNYNQVAAFQFVDVIRLNDRRYTKLAIEKLSVVADRLGDETLLNYAVARLNTNDLPESNRDMLYFRIGEIKQKSGDYSAASDLYAKINNRSRFFYNALFNRGLSELERNQVDLAIQSFKVLADARKEAKVTDTNKVAASMAIARAYYQKGDWEQAIEYYSRVPRDHIYWHDAMFEKSWAMLRAARFRSALSNFQSLHSAYYEDAYIPESLLLRAIVYLYICKYDEMEKVLSLFEKEYGPVRKQVSNLLRTTNDANVFYGEMEKAQQMRKNPDLRNKLRVPFSVARHILSQSDVKRNMSYLRRLNEEKQRVDENASFKQSPIGMYATKILNNRMKNTKLAIGEQAKAHLLNVRVELKDLYEQSSFIRYEMINGQKEDMKKRLAGKDLSREQIDEQNDRKFYVENGYEYYPFQGEYWLDEIGNYHYLGKQSCE